jgi:hypothetical protein
MVVQSKLDFKPDPYPYSAKRVTPRWTSIGISEARKLKEQEHANPKFLDSSQHFDSLETNSNLTQSFNL